MILNAGKNKIEVSTLFFRAHKSRLILFFFSFLFVCLFQNTLYAQSLYEDFNYNAGENIGGNTATTGGPVNNWFTHSSNTTGTIDVLSGSLTYPGLQGSSGNKVRLPGANTTVPRDVNRAISGITGNVAYYSFLINVVDATQLSTSASPEYFMHFGATSGTSVSSFGARVGARSVNGGANFHLLIQNTSGGTPNFTENLNDLSFGTTYLVVVKYDRGVSPTVASLWINPASLGGVEPSGQITNSSGTSAFSSFASICLRNASNTPKADIDEIRVGTTWASVTPAAPAGSNCPFSTSVLPSTDVISCIGNKISNRSAQVTLSGGSGSPTQLYQWYYNTSNSNSISTATLIPGATSQAFSPPTTIADTGTRYYFCVAYATDNGCAQTNATQSLASTNTVKVTVNNASTAAPTGSSSQSFCSSDNPTVGNLSATGTSIKWYFTSGLQALPATSIINGLQYLATQTVNGCESMDSLRVTVNINTSPAAVTGNSPQFFCNGTNPTISNLSASSVNTLVWYNRQSGSPALSSSTTLLSDSTYFGAQIDANGCRSATLLPVRVVILPAIQYGSISRFEGLRYPVISQVYGSGGNAGALYLNDYVELFNPSADTINLTSWSLQYQSSTASVWSSIANLSGTIAPGKYYLVRLGSSGSVGNPLVSAQATGSTSIASSDGKIALVRSTTLASSCTDANIVDKIGVGTNTVVCNEGASSATAPSNATQALFRSTGGCTDSNVNGLDFSRSTASPKNDSWPSAICNGPSGETICVSGIPDTMMVGGTSGAVDFTYQWYYQEGAVAAPTGSSTSGWISLGSDRGANTAVYKPNTAISSTRTYACFVTPSGSPLCGAIGQWASGVNVVTISNTPAIPVFPSGSGLNNNQTTCSGLTGRTYSVTPASGVSQYNWTVPADWVITSGQNTNSITVTTGSTSGNVSVTAGNSCGTSASANLAVIISTLPAPPIASAASAINSGGFTANWASVAGAVSYNLDVFYFKNADTVAAWNFPSGTSPLTAHVYNANNASSALTTTGGTGVISVVTSTPSFAATASGWNGGNGTKAWQISINTAGYTSLKLSSRQRSSNTGPRDFKLQYKIGNAGAWTDVPSGTVQVDALYTLGVVNDLALPVACENQPLVYIRWLVNSDFAVDGSFIASGGTNRIDEIVVSGVKKDYVPGFLNYSTSNLSEEVAGLQPNTTYYYVVRALVPCGATLNSNEIQVTTLPPCVSAASISSFTPSSGPAGTRVTIRGSGFNNVSSVRFGLTNAPNFSLINDSTILVTVPDGVSRDKIRLPIGVCPAESVADFVPIETNSGCGNTGSAATDLFISEVYDADRGTLSYVELFNGTTNPISLTGVYALRIVFNGNVGSAIDINLTGTLNSGNTYLIKIKDAIDTSTLICPIDNAVNLISATGSFNGNDQIYLRKNNVNLDYIPNPNFGGGTSAGFSQLRKPGVVVPSTSYNVNDWETSLTESCNDLGLPPYSLAGTTIDISAQPADNNNCSSVDFAISASSSAGSLNYLWKYYDPSTDQWINASGLTDATAGTTASGTNATAMSVTGNTGQLFGYQFYCELTKLGCTVNSKAVQHSYQTRRYYRPKSSGPWSNAAIWEMSDQLNDWTGAAAACASPSRENSSAVILQAPFAITQDIDLVLDYLEIKPGATLTTTQNASLNILDSTSGPDLVINGTWNYDANATNSALGAASTGTWQLGSSGSIIKTSDGSAGNLRDKYHGGMSSIPASANWILRFTGASTNVTFTTTGGSYYPNLVFENFIGGTWKPQSRFSGTSDFAIVKGNLDVGGSGTGVIDSLINENKNPNPLQIQGNLIIRAGSRLMTSSAATGFEIKGNLINEGKLVVNSNDSGLIKFSGNANQQISGGGDFDIIDMEIANSGGALTVQSNLEIPGNFRMGNSASLSFGSGNIKIKSSASKTASIGPLQNVNIQYNGVGRFIVERYISSGRKWRHLSVPVNSDTLSIKNAWQNSMIITGNTSDWSSKGFDGFSPGGPSMKIFDPAIQGYKAVNRTDSLLRNPAGFMVFVRGDRTCLPGNFNLAPTTLATPGPIYVGNQLFNIPPGGFTSIGNPYASSIDMRKLVKSGYDTSFIYVWDPNLSGGYGLGGMQTMKFKNGNFYAVPGGGSYADSNIFYNLIQSGQAFFVHNSGVNQGSVTFTESAKELGSKLVFRSTKPEDHIKIDLCKNVNSSSAFPLLDGVEVEFSSDASNEVGSDDARKFPNAGENISIKRDNKLLAIESRKPLKNRDSIHVSLSGLRPGKYVLKLQAEINENQMQGYLADRFLNTMTEISLSGMSEYLFEISDASSARSDRFYLFFKKGSTSGNIVVKKLADAGTPDAVDSLTIFPNPVTGRSFQVSLPAELADQQAQFFLLDPSGKKFLLPVMNFGPRIFKFKLPDNLSSGLYQLLRMGESKSQTRGLFITD